MEQHLKTLVSPVALQPVLHVDELNQYEEGGSLFSLVAVSVLILLTCYIIISQVNVHLFVILNLSLLSFRSALSHQRKCHYPRSSHAHKLNYNQHLTAHSSAPLHHPSGPSQLEVYFTRQSGYLRMAEAETGPEELQQSTVVFVGQGLKEAALKSWLEDCRRKVSSCLLISHAFCVYIVALNYFALTSNYFLGCGNTNNLRGEALQVFTMNTRTIRALDVSP